MSFVNAHFITYVQDLGYQQMVAAGAFSLIGAAAIIGALLLGHLSDQHGRRKLLSFSYNLRALGFILVL
ncbi:MAG: MFS transporter, partial [Chloroflexi bacterium]|nr:MFS transporter [Chloroflexota bacterium]